MKNLTLFLLLFIASCRHYVEAPKPAVETIDSASLPVQCPIYLAKMSWCLSTHWLVPPSDDGPGSFQIDFYETSKAPVNIQSMDLITHVYFRMDSMIHGAARPEIIPGAEPHQLVVEEVWLHMVGTWQFHLDLYRGKDLIDRVQWNYYYVP